MQYEKELGFGYCDFAKRDDGAKHHTETGIYKDCGIRRNFSSTKGGMEIEHKNEYETLGAFQHKFGIDYFYENIYPMFPMPLLSSYITSEMLIHNTAKIVSRIIAELSILCTFNSTTNSKIENCCSMCQKAGLHEVAHHFCQEGYFKEGNHSIGNDSLELQKEMENAACEAYAQLLRVIIKLKEKFRLRETELIQGVIMFNKFCSRHWRCSCFILFARLLKTMFLVCVMVAHKTSADVCIKNGAWASNFGISINALNEYERDFLVMMDYDIISSVEEYEECCNVIIKGETSSNSTRCGFVSPELQHTCTFTASASSSLSCSTRPFCEIPLLPVPLSHPQMDEQAVSSESLHSSESRFSSSNTSGMIKASMSYDISSSSAPTLKSSPSTQTAPSTERMSLSSPDACSSVASSFSSGSLTQSRSSSIDSDIVSTSENSSVMVVDSAASSAPATYLRDSSSLSPSFNETHSSSDMFSSASQTKVSEQCDKMLTTCSSCVNDTQTFSKIQDLNSSSHRQIACSAIGGFNSAFINPTLISLMQCESSKCYLSKCNNKLIRVKGK
ncbi:uncharacterized protein MONOS_11406 [Monocercomonoides exilis]|uniref:uncharacterized protein n=1 Tax=Monocercomonoides exilis TaxID=2049356 RepID=UPI00355A5195|nr:hypothetical protein MONOS_11406 [Monocercomonoides exilis]|eukprot:MONOS_11406.1-p1 / transcript=MONOS_11406.1 / gene=MONOS_11406 / organism=Monocercomonoides_exilis_PA203 / gene_product=unspecified product / transcript_product=unspecified product / location=Mono_scaffold00570:4951-6627(+) / protein_length=558 / sequence_SO=supercontig / SO=protein_coding / is_pseudo=false